MLIGKEVFLGSFDGSAAGCRALISLLLTGPHPTAEYSLFEEYHPRLLFSSSQHCLHPVHLINYTFSQQGTPEVSFVIFNSLVEESAAYIARDLLQLFQNNHVEHVYLIGASSLHTLDSSLFYFPIFGTPSSKCVEGCQLMDPSVETGSQLFGFLVELLRFGEVPCTLIATQMEKFPRPSSLAVTHRLTKHLATVLAPHFSFQENALNCLTPVKGALPAITSDISTLYI